MSYYYMYRRMGRGAMLMSAGATLLVMIYYVRSIYMLVDVVPRSAERAHTHDT